MLPAENDLYMSLTAVHFDSQEGYAGHYHKHSSGEINCVVPIDKVFQLEGLLVGEDWHSTGWTCLAPGTHHYSRARGGRRVAFFFIRPDASRTMLSLASRS